MPEKPLSVGSLFSGIPSEDSTSASSEPVCALCGSASRTPSAGGSLPGTGPESRVIPTCAPLWPTPTLNGNYNRKGLSPTSGDGLATAVTNPTVCPCRCHTSTSSAAGSPARTSHWPAAGPDWPGNARVFGGNSQGSLGNYDPATSSLRTFQLSLLLPASGTANERSAPWSETWPRAGSMRNGTIYQRQPLAPLTGGTASGLLPTPKTSDANGHSAREVAEGNPRSRLVTEVQINPWPTPTARLGTARGPQAKRYHDPARSNDLDDAVAASGTPGSLNPTFVEWLQGFPRNWTKV